MTWIGSERNGCSLITPACSDKGSSVGYFVGPQNFVLHSEKHASRFLHRVLLPELVPDLKEPDINFVHDKIFFPRFIDFVNRGLENTPKYRLDPPPPWCGYSMHIGDCMHPIYVPHHRLVKGGPRHDA